MIPLRIVFAMLVATTISAQADEGMWLFNNPPLRQLKENYQFEPTPQWLEHLQKASVRFNSGGSGSFVSADGLCITNHHVGADALQKASSEQHNYLKEGFYRKTNTEEIKCADLELNVLISTEDVTARVSAAVKSGMTPDQASAARGNAIALIEKESKEKTGLRSDVVTLYQGGAYHLYRYKRYDDVRIVFAPEQQAAFYGSDPDNFDYPRYDLDMCIFSAYENGEPTKPEHFMKWKTKEPSDNEIILVSSYPGKAERKLKTRECCRFIITSKYRANAQPPPTGHRDRSTARSSNMRAAFSAPATNARNRMVNASRNSATAIANRSSSICSRPSPFTKMS